MVDEAVKRRRLYNRSQELYLLTFSSLPSEVGVLTDIWRRGASVKHKTSFDAR